MNHKLTLLVSSLIFANAVSAATFVDVKHQPVSFLSKGIAQLQEGRTEIDFNQIAHTRAYQVIDGLKVWNAEVVVHTPNISKHVGSMLNRFNSQSTMNGGIYEGIQKDLAGTTRPALTDAKKAAIIEKMNAHAATKKSIKPIIFVDDNHRAHYAYLVSFYVDNGMTGTQKPTAILDAITLQVYRQWDQVKTIKPPLTGEPDNVLAGGVGGNEKMGKVFYDGTAENLPGLSMKRFLVDIEPVPGQTMKVSYCLFDNDDIVVKDVSYGGDIVGDLCIQRGNILWLSNDDHFTRWKRDEMNAANSPSLDAFYTATVVKNMYQDWYGIPALVEKDGKTPMKMVMRVHYGRSFDNAFWDGEQMTFGDGGTKFYPLTSLDVTAHEISHGFTEQNSNIDYSRPQMGGLHESFSDMGAVAANFYLSGKNHWDMSRDVWKGEGAMRYMDNPRKDMRSIDHMKDYADSINSHLLAGVTNKAFYLLATSKGWDVRKAFNVMVKANQHYWNSSMSTFAEAACGVVSATKDYGYDVADVRIAFLKVGVDTEQC